MAQQFELASRDWREPNWLVHAVVSSLAIHYLDGEQKQELFRDICPMLQTGGVFLIADVVQPANPLVQAVAAQAWDDAVLQRSIEFDSSTRAFDQFRELEWNMFRYPDPIDKPSSVRSVAMARGCGIH